MKIFCYSFPSKMIQNSFWRPWGLWGLMGGSLDSLLFSAGLGSLFHRFGRCPNHDDFLLQFTVQSAPKLVFVTLAPFGTSGGARFVAPLSPHKSQFHCGSILNSAFKPLAGTRNSHSNFVSVVDSTF